MKTVLLLVGDEFGLRDGADALEYMPKGYSGPTGTKAIHDPEFVAEIVRRRSVLELSAVKLSLAAGYSGGYMSMVEKGTRYPSEEAKTQIRETLTRMEQK